MKFRNYIYLLLVSSVLFSSSCSKKHYIVHQQDAQYYKFQKNKNDRDDSATEMVIAPYREKLAKEMNEVLIYSEVELIRAKPNSTLGNWITDVIFEETIIQTKLEIDGAFQNYGGIRINSMPSGPITKGKIFEVMPFENMAVILHMEGNVLQQLCDRIVAYGGWPTSQSI